MSFVWPQSILSDDELQCLFLRYSFTSVSEEPQDPVHLALAQVSLSIEGFTTFLLSQTRPWGLKHTI